MTQFFDGTESMPWIYHDGGRSEAGFKGSARDCVTRSIAIITAKPYIEVYQNLSEKQKSQKTKNSSKQNTTARNGIYTKTIWFKAYMKELGFTWVPTMKIGQGCKVHLLKGELPSGQLVVSLSKHFTAVVDHIIYDTSNPYHGTVFTENGVQRIAHRCVYGYWILNS
jgi:hypothetical protein